MCIYKMDKKGKSCVSFPRQADKIDKNEPGRCYWSRRRCAASRCGACGAERNI
jgi:hypothetical protein